MTSDKRDVTNPCAMLYSGLPPFARPPMYLSFCPYATVIKLDNGIVVPMVCKSFNRYDQENTVNSYKDEVHWSMRHIKGEWETFTLLPYQSNATKSSDSLYKKQFHRPERPVFKANEDGFSDNTIVWTRYGQVPIGKIKPGWRMISYDFSRAAWTETLVIAVNNGHCNFVRIEFEGSSIECSENQKFYLVKSKQWVCAKDLKESESELLVTSEVNDSFLLERVKSIVGIGTRNTTCLTLKSTITFV